MRYALIGMLLACSTSTKDGNTGLTTVSSPSGTTSTTTTTTANTGSGVDTSLCDANTGADLAMLTDGVTELRARGSYASTILTHTASAFPVVLDNDGHPLIAASNVGDGHVMHLGHEHYLSGSLSEGDGGRLIQNAIAIPAYLF